MIQILLIKNKYLNTPGNNTILCPTEMILTDTIKTLKDVETTVWYYDEIDYSKSVELFMQGFKFDIVIFRLHPYPTPQWITTDIIGQLHKVIPDTPFVVWWGDSCEGCDHAYMTEIDKCMQLSIYYDSPTYATGITSIFHTGLYNTSLFKDAGLERTIDVSIAGENTRENRRKIIESLRLNGIIVTSVGGWIEGWVSDEEYVQTYQKSKIALGILGKDQDQLRAKIFEIPLCGAMLLTDDTDIAKFIYKPNKECITFSDEFEALEACEYYLEHDDERLAIAEAGHKRALEICDAENYYNFIFELKRIK